MAEDSKYLRLVERWAAEIGVKTAWVAGPTPGCAAYVADTEAGWPMWDLPREEDVDCICHDGLSCAAYAALCLLSWYGAGRGVRKVCVLGRGHAVQGLRGALERMGYQVTQCAGRGAASDGWVWRRRCGDLRRAAFGTAGQAVRRSWWI